MGGVAAHILFYWAFFSFFKQKKLKIIPLPPLI
jgi:hypothetical protein